MKIISRKFSCKNFLLLLAIGLLLLLYGWLTTGRVEAANENSPPSKINLNGIFTTPMGSNSSIIGGDIVQVTAGTTYQMGGIWSTDTNKMDLTKDFHASMYLYFGNQGANAADGMAFVMHNDRNGTNARSPHDGSSLGVYAGQDYGSSKTDGIQNSFAVEFDTHVNNGGGIGDGYFDTNVTAGDHVAWSFPGDPNTYIDFADWLPVLILKRTMKHNNIDGPNNGVQYPGLLSNDTWRQFTIDWNAATSTLTYQLQGLNPVSVPINVSAVFGSNSVYWGFTGSTGAKYEMNRVTFDEVPGLVNAEVNETITKSNGSVVESSAPVYKGEELTYTINAKYFSGKQDWMNIMLNTVLNNHVSYVPNSMTLTTPGGTEVLADGSWTGQSLALGIPNMNASMHDVTVSFKVKVNKVLQSTPITEQSKFVGDNHIIQTAPVDYVILPNQVPEMTIREAGPINLAGEDYEVLGTWKDLDDSKGNLHFVLNSQLLQIEEKQNGGSSQPVDWSYLLSKDQLTIGENTFEVYATDDDGATSNVASLKIIVESLPIIRLINANMELPIDFGTDYTINGTWSDLDSDFIDLYYVVDSDTPVKFASSVSNSTNKGEEINYQYSIPAAQFSLGMHQVTVFAVDDTGRQSNIEKLTVNVTGDLIFTGVAENVSFEDVKISNQPTISKRNNDWDIFVKDTRGNGSEWRLTATLTEEFSESNGNYLRNALIFVDESGFETTMSPGIATHVYENVTTDPQELLINWNTDQGILMKIDPSVYIGGYTGVINWNLIDAP